MPIISNQGKSWNLRDLKDTRENVIESVKAAAFVPDACKAMLVEALEAHPGRLIRLDAHCRVASTPKGLKHILTMDISEL